MFNSITSAALILISIGVMVVYISPTYKEISVLRVQNEELSTAILKTKDIENTSRELSEKMRSFSKNDLDRLERLLPPTFDELRFINSMQGVAARNGVAIQGVTIDTTLADSNASASRQGPSAATPGTQGKYTAHTFSISVSAAYDVFLRFLKDLERSLQFIDITSVALSQPAGGPSGEGLYTYTVEFNTYSLK